jgi:hypothetical protein
MLDWLIIGGGVHGCVIAHALLRYGGVAPRDLAIVDDHPEPLATWKRRTFSCGMRYLRSPAAHAIVPDFTGMLAWAKEHGYHPGEHTIPPYARPSLELFCAHTDAMIRESGLRSRWRTGAARLVERDARSGRWVTTLDDGSRSASRNVVLAPGRSDGLKVPQWALPAPGRIVHVFDDRFERAAAERASRPLVVGAGVTGVHLALHLARGGAHVGLMTRHPIRVAQFDSDPCYIGPSCLEEYLAHNDPADRRRILRDVRNPGSVPPELARELERRIARRNVELIDDEVQRARSPKDGVVELLGGRGTYESDFVTLATGFAPGPPGGRVREALANGRATGTPLPVDEVGYPLPDRSLQWDTGLFVTGTLAEHELGPSAPNIIGAHNAAKRIVGHLANLDRRVPGAWRRYAPASVSNSSDSA